MTLRLSLVGAALLACMSAPAAAQCVPASIARNNPAFTAPGTPDACAPKPKVAEKPKALRPEERTVSAMDLDAKRAGKTPEVTRDADGTIVTRVGDTEMRINGYVRYDFTTSSKDKLYRVR
jgi:hypothetical protein